MDSMQSVDYGGEVMGIIRPPLFETNRERGFSVFLMHQFIGNALIQFQASHFKLLLLSNFFFYIY